MIGAASIDLASFSGVISEASAATGVA